MGKNSFILGCFIGLLAPGFAYLLIRWYPSSSLFGEQGMGPYAIAALINLLIVRVFYRKALEKSAHGVVLVTFVAALAVIFAGRLSL